VALIRHALLGCLGLLLLSGAAQAASGIQGRVSWRGETIAGVKVRAYLQIEDIAAGKVLAVSAPSAADGTYRLELPPGDYVLTARSFEGEPAPGDYFCYFSGSPARVRPESFTSIGFNLIRIPEEAAPVIGKQTGISGEISFRDAPLERVYLYVYRDAADGFKGPGYNIVPVERGRFKLRLPPGDYYLLARKRAKGGRFGPIETGDYFNYYFRNPLHIAAGELREVKIETVTRLSLFEDEQVAFQGVRGQVLGPDDRPAAGLYVFGYRAAAMTGTPAVFSAPTAADGRFELELPETGNWYLLARESFGGPAGDGELYGRFAGGAPVRFDTANAVDGVTIHVERKTHP